MILAIYLFAVLLLAAGIILLVKPSFVLDFIVTYSETTSLYAGAIVVRLLLGALLLAVADLSRYPAVVAVIGWIALLAALVFLVIGQNRFQQMLKWIIGKIRPWGRMGGVAALVFGFFLLYAFV